MPNFRQVFVNVLYVYNRLGLMIKIISVLQKKIISCVEKLLSKMSTSSDNIQGTLSQGLSTLEGKSVKTASAVWQTPGSKALEVLALDKLTPQFGGLRELQWGQLTKQVFDEYPRVRDSDKLRLIFNRAMSIGKKDMTIKSAFLLTKIAKYGEHVSALNEFWDWVNNKYTKSRERQQERLSTFTKESTIGSDVNPVEALEEALWEYDFQWEDIETDSKIQNITVNVIRRDINYVKVEELMERNPSNWKSYLEQEWTKYAAAAYHRRSGYIRNWEKKSGGRGSRRLNLDF